MCNTRISTHYDHKSACIQKLNKSQTVEKEDSPKMVAQFRIGMVPYLG
jgi:hypothetical protein